MDGYRYVRCLFCETGKEERVVRFIHEKGWGRAIFPQRVKRLLKNRVWKEVPVPLLPGYVFVYSDQEAIRHDEYRKMDHVLRVLTYQEGMDTLAGRDLEFADWLWRVEGRVEVMKAAQAGDRIEIIDGVFKQLHGTITRMDRRRKTIRVELEAAGSIRQIWLSYEIVQKLDETPAAQKMTTGAMM